MEDMTDEQRKQLEEKLKNMSPEELAEFQKQQCIFCQIISGKIPSKKIYEDEVCIAILDINPATKGHILLLPKEHYAIMPQVPDEVIGHLFKVSKKLSQSLLKGMRATGTNVFIANGLAAGQKAQHFMLHVIPRKEGDGIIEVEEKLIDKEMIEKIKSAVEGKLNSLLGVEVQKTLTEEKEEDVVEEAPKEDADDEVSEDEDEPEAKEESEDEDQEEDSDNEQAEDEPEESDDKDDGDASLNDIANLFK
jgi:histidine triad (HIT) family protein